MADAVGKVDGQHEDRGSTDRSAAHEVGTMPAKVQLPAVTTRMEKPCLSPGLGVHASQVRPFMTVACEAGERKVLRLGLASMLFRDNVIHLEIQDIAGLRHVAVFTTIACSPPDQPFESFPHDGNYERSRCRSTWRARDCNVESNAPTRS